MARCAVSSAFREVTGYKIFNRYKECGLDALNDRSRRPYRHANKLPFQVERTILAIKREHSILGRAEDPRQADPCNCRCSSRRRPARSTPCWIGTGS